MKRVTVFAAVCIAALIVLKLAKVNVWAYFSPRALIFVTLYTAVLVLVRYSPGRCFYRFAVLGDPGRHLPLEIVKARDFAAYVSIRLLFAGLIFSLAEVSGVLFTLPDIVSGARALSSALLASLYALFLYIAIARWSESSQAA